MFNARCFLILTLLLTPVYSYGYDVEEPVVEEGAIVFVYPAQILSPADGEQLQVSIQIAQAVDVTGYQFTLEFDPTALRYVESSHADYLPDGAVFIPTVASENSVRIAAASEGGAAIASSGTLATITFEVIAKKASTLTLSEVTLADSKAEGLPLTAINGEIGVTVINEEISAPQDLGTLGLFITSVPGTNFNAAPGISLGFSSGSSPNPYAIDTEFRGAFGEEPGGDTFSFLSWSIGGRYFFKKHDISPYIGGGLSLSGATVERPRRDDWSDTEKEEDVWRENAGGGGVYIISGIETPRTYPMRLKLELRVDRPFFSLPNQDIMPLSIGLFLSSDALGEFYGGCISGFFEALFSPW